MDIKVLAATFTTVFVAELADKTQLVALAMSAKTSKILSVWIGSVVAYMIITCITVLVGAAFSQYIKPDIIKYIGGALFIVLGVFMLAGKI